MRYVRRDERLQLGALMSRYSHCIERVDCQPTDRLGRQIASLRELGDVRK